MLDTKAELLRGFLAHLSKPDDETVTLYADGRAAFSVSSSYRGTSASQNRVVVTGGFAIKTGATSATV
jgi:hypothetical protein